MRGTAERPVQCLGALLLVAALAHARETSDPFDPAALQQRIDGLQPLVEAALGVELGPVEARAVSRDALRAVVLGELLELISGVEDLSAEQARAAAAQGAELMARMGLGKTVRETQEVLICPENFQWLATLAPEYGAMLEPAFLDLILVHELVHVAQFRTLHAAGMLQRCATSEELRVGDAILEGHAQHVARAIAERRGLAAQFRLFARTQTTPPSTITDPGLRQMLELSGATMGFSYVQGEKFVAAVVEALGREEAERRLFGDPPRRLRLVGQPELYLDPALDTAPSVDLEACRGVLRRLWEERFGPAHVGALTRPVLQAALAALGPDEAARLAGLARDGFAVACGRERTVMVVDAGTPEAAREILGGQVALLHARDAQFSAEEGALRIVAADYRDIDAFGGPGVAYRKTVEVRDGGLRIRTAGATGVHGSLLLEVALVGGHLEPDLVDRLAREVRILIAGAGHDAPWSGLHGEEARAAVLATLEHPDPDLRWRAVRNAARMRVPDEEKRAALRARLADGAGHVRATALRLLLGLDWERHATEGEWQALARDDDFEVAWELVSRIDPDPAPDDAASPLTRTALRLLQRWPRMLDEHAGAVRGVAARGDGPLRVEAVLALHAGGDRSAHLLGFLLDALGERTSEDGERLIAALSDWPADGIPDRAIALLLAAAPPGRPDGVRRAAVQALGRLGGRAAHALDGLDAIAGDPSDPLAPLAAEAAAAVRRAGAGGD